MRDIRKLANTTTILLVAILTFNTPPVSADNHPTDGDTNVVTDGSSAGNAIQASAGAFGGATKGGRQCGWQRGWPTQTGSTSLVNIPSALTG